MSLLFFCWFPLGNQQSTILFEKNMKFVLQSSKVNADILRWLQYVLLDNLIQINDGNVSEDNQRRMLQLISNDVLYENALLNESYKCYHLMLRKKYFLVYVPTVTFTIFLLVYMYPFPPRSSNGVAAKVISVQKSLGWRKYVIYEYSIDFPNWIHVLVWWLKGDCAQACK